MVIAQWFQTGVFNLPECQSKYYCLIILYRPLDFTTGSTFQKVTKMAALAIWFISSPWQLYAPTCRNEVYGYGKYRRAKIASIGDSSSSSLATLLKRTSFHFHRTLWLQKPGQREAGTHENWLLWLTVFTTLRLHLKPVIHLIMTHAGID